MEVAHSIAPKAGDAVLMVGTTKGAFLLCANAARRRWEVSGPHFPGHVVYALAYDGRAGRSRIWLSSSNWAYGTPLVVAGCDLSAGPSPASRDRDDTLKGLGNAKGKLRFIAIMTTLYTATNTAEPSILTA